MEHQGPSRTAVTSAVYRAAHLLLDGGKLLADPSARAFAGYDNDDEMLRAADAADWPSFRRMRFQFALRNRYTEDRLVEATSRAICQYVILGAGLDSFAYRRPDLMACLDVFEVDHPASQKWKRARVNELGIPTPARLYHLAIDFERQTLGASLLDSKVDLGRPVFVSLLGLTQYLTEDAVLHLLADLAGAAVTGSEIASNMLCPRRPFPARKLSWSTRGSRTAGRWESLGSASTSRRTWSGG